MANRQIQRRSETEKNIHIKKAIIYYKCIYRYWCEYKHENKHKKRILCTSNKPCYYRIAITKFGENKNDKEMQI